LCSVLISHISRAIAFTSFLRMDPTIVSSVFVDDYDPDIVYKGDWIQVEGRPTDMGSMVYPQVIHTPWYGTLHTTISPNASLSYVFKGNFFTMS